MTVQESKGAEDSVRSRARHGLTWSLAGTATLKLGSFVMGLVLARLLSPTDFGVYAIALAFTQLAIFINDVGVTAALIQWRGSLEEVAPTARTLTYAMAGTLTTVVIVFADALARWAGDPASAGVLRILAVTVLLDGLMAVSTATMWREFRQQRFAAATLTGFLVQPVTAVPLALAGVGAYSFAVAMLLDAAVRYVLVTWWSGVSIVPGFDHGCALRLVKFGLPLVSGLAVQALLLNADYVVVGRTTDVTQVGFYMLAFNVSSWVPGVVGTALGSVSLAAFARMAEQGASVLSAGVRDAVMLLVKVLVPLVVGLSVFATPLIELLYGARWLPSAPVLAWLAVFIVPRMLAQMGTEVLIAQGRTRYPVIANVAWFVVLVPALYLGADRFGILGAAVAQVAVGLVLAVPLITALVVRAGVDAHGLAASVLRPLFAGLVTTAAALLARAVLPSAPLLVLAVGGVAVLVLYVPVALTAQERRTLLAQVGVRTRAPVETA